MHRAQPPARLHPHHPLRQQLLRQQPDLVLISATRVTATVMTSEVLFVDFILSLSNSEFLLLLFFPLRMSSTIAANVSPYYFYVDLF